MFALVAALAMAGLCLGHVRFWRAVVKSENLRIEEGKDTIIIGDSHTQTGIDEQWLDHAVNVSASAVHYLFTYAVLKTLLEANPQIRTVVLAYSFHNLNTYYDDFLWARNMTNALLEDYYYLLGDEERSVVRINNWSYWGTYAKYALGVPLQLNFGFYAKVIRGDLKARDFPLWGKSYKSFYSNLTPAHLRWTVLAHFYRKDGLRFQGMSALQVRYLEKIIELCRARDVKLNLLIMPVHPSYRAHIPGPMMDVFDQFTRNLINRYPEISLWDYSNERLADFMFGDGDHLNVYGAQVFSNILKLRLENMDKQ